MSDKPGLLQVYEPGYEEVVLEPGRPWVPVRHRWSCAFGRPGQPVEIAPVYVLLASPEASFVTGEVWGVTGGAGVG